MKDAIGFGALNVDYVYEIEDFQFFKEKFEFKFGAERTFSPREFNLSLKILEKTARLKAKSGGGSAANTIFALARMGFSTGFIGKVGKDKEGDFLLKSLRQVDTSRVVKGGQSGLALCLLDKRGERSILVLPNSNNSLTFEEIDLKDIKETKFFHFTSFRGESPFEAQKRLIKILPSKVLLSFDPGEIYARKGLESLLPFIKASFIIFLSDKEVEILTERDWRESTRELLKYGPKIVVCKRGENGSSIFSKNEEFEVKAPKVKVVDKTGAGDVYVAGFLAGLLLNRSLFECAQLATKAAALSITGFGRKNYPTRKFLENVLREFG